MRIQNQEFGVTASIGIATYPQDGRDAQTLQKNADIAMLPREGPGTQRLLPLCPAGQYEFAGAAHNGSAAAPCLGAR
jgi:hypothetical protein